MSRAKKGPFASALVLLALLLSSCQLVLGDFEIGDVPHGGTPAGCKEQSFRCNGPWLFCESAGSSDFIRIDECATPEQCDSTVGRCAVCTAGDFRCNGTKLETCRQDRTGWTTVVECATANECNLNSRSCRVCTPGEMPQCTGPEQRDLFECGADTQWQPLGTCATAELCTLSAEAIAADPIGAPRACVEPVCPLPGMYRCDDDTLGLSRCAPDQAGWTSVDSCGSAALCTRTIADPAAADARGGKCVPPVCFPAGDYRCTGDTLEVCGVDLVGWEAIETCLAPYQCNTNQRACTGPCTPGDLQCSGSTLQRCSALQVWEHDAECVNASLCSVILNAETALFEGGCVDPACPMPGDYTCIDHELRRCNSEQTAWELIETCRSVSLCRAIDQRCETPTCEPGGALGCNPENPSELRVCHDELTHWETVEVCAVTEACNTDVNGPPCVSQCPDPPERCNDVSHETCSGVTGQPVWTGQATCRTLELCECGLDDTCPAGLATDGLCGNPVCGSTLGSTRCLGSWLETCQSGRNGWDQTEDCGSASMCVPGTAATQFFDNGFCAACSVASERMCDGDVLRSCSSDRRSWVSSVTCTIGAGCVTSGTNDYCAECASGDVRCNSGRTQPCGTDSRWGALTTCPLGCLGSANNGYCAECNPGDARCTSGGLQTCGTDSRWGTTTTCALGCLGSGSNGYCAECNPGDARCTSGGLQTCGSNSRWGSAVSCTLGCLGSGNNGYCAECSSGDARCTSGGLETCNSSSLWDSAVTCTLGCLGSGSNGYCAECSSGDARCTSGGLETCNSSSLWGSAVTCTLGCLGSGNNGYCAECSSGDARCTSGGLESCNSSSLWGSAVTCTLGCLGSGNNGYCAECSSGDARCTSGGLESCNTSSLWGSAVTCTLGCLGSGNNGYCAECSSGDARCTSGGLESCNTSSLWGSAMTCPLGCFGSGTNGYCGECTPGETLCQGSDLLTCENTALWSSPAACYYGCVDDAPDFCAECGSDADCTPLYCVNDRCL